MTSFKATGVRTRLSDKEFRKLQKIVDSALGIKMPDTKRVMLESRLHRRLKILGVSSYSDYIDFLISDEGKETEIVEFYNAVTTNKTDFFRERSHFDFLSEKAIPLFIQKNMNELNIWSCGCSSGEELYTMVIVLEQARIKYVTLDYSLMGTDISTKVLTKAKEAVYSEDDVAVIPVEWRKQYFLKGKGENHDLYKVKPTLTQKVRLGRMNLMSPRFSIPGSYHIIFCRNVLIYFDRFRQQEIIEKLCQKLVQGGFLFLGHSESMAGMNLNLDAVDSAVYRKI